jgi:hypothetical protein
MIHQGVLVPLKVQMVRLVTLFEEEDFGYSMIKRRPASIEACKRRNNRVLRLNQVELIDEDIEWLSKTEQLTLWNVKAPTGLLASIETLWWLDIRGGSASDLEVAKGARNLRYLAVNQVRGMCDLSIVVEMLALRYLSVYGLPKVTELPKCAKLVKLEHASIGQLGGLVSLGGLLQAPNLRELELIRKINVSDKDVNEIIKHPTIKAFSWFAEDVPDKVWKPVLEKIALPAVQCMHPEEWFQLPEYTTAK